MSQHDLQAAITSLEASTVAIHSQDEILRTQRKYLESVQRRRVEDSSKLRTRRLASQNLVLAVEEGTEALTGQLHEVQQRLRGAINQILSSVPDYLRYDDRYLQKMSTLSLLGADDGEDTKKKVEKLTAKLSDLAREQIECRLERVYLQHLTKDAAKRDDEQPVLDELELELELDLKSLHVEIADVANMSTLQNFQAPLLHALTQRQLRKDNQARAVLEDVSNCMTLIAKSAATCVSRLEALQSCQTAISAYQAEFDSLAQKFSVEAGASRQRQNPRTELVSPAVQDALKHWNVFIPDGGSAEHSLWARKIKVEQDVRRSNATVEDTLQSHLSRLPMDIERLLEEDNGAEVGLVRFEQDMQKLREAMDRIDLARIGEVDSTTAPFMKRWLERS